MKQEITKIFIMEDEQRDYFQKGFIPIRITNVSIKFDHSFNNPMYVAKIEFQYPYWIMSETTEPRYEWRDADSGSFLVDSANSEEAIKKWFVEHHFFGAKPFLLPIEPADSFFKMNDECFLSLKCNWVFDFIKNDYAYNLPPFDLLIQQLNEYLDKTHSAKRPTGEDITYLGKLYRYREYLDCRPLDYNDWGIACRLKEFKDLDLIFKD